MSIVYKTVNTINDKYYIGVHTKDDPEYLGSGTHLKRAIKKYGRDNFTRTVIFEGTTEECLNLEKMLVNSNFIKKQTNYNLTEGGGMPPQNEWTDERRKRFVEFMQGNSYKKGKSESEETRHKKRIAFAKSETHAVHTKNKSQETCKKISKNRKGKSLGIRNSMAEEVNRKKVGASKVGRKKIINPDGGFMYVLPKTSKWNELIAMGWIPNGN